MDNIKDQQDHATDSSEEFEDEEEAFNSTYEGHSSTWLSLTREDRMIAKSIEAEQGQDLSIHLYNAHSLKRRAADPAARKKLREWQSRERWLRKSLTSNEDGSDNFVPSRAWTAWPLPPELVPREGEQIGQDDGDEDYTYRKRDTLPPSQTLEEMLTAITLKMAKEKFQERKWEDSAEGASRQASEPRTGAAASDKMVLDDQVPSQRSQSKKSSESRSRDRSRHRGKRQRNDDSEPVQLSATSSSSPPLQLRPGISTDEERNERLLAPATRHLLSRLDDLLTSLHKTREAILRDKAGSESTTEGETSGAQTPIKRRRVGRPSKRRLSTEEKESEPADLSNAESSPAPKKRARGRPKKEVPLLPGETEYERLVRVARLRRRRIPSPGSVSNPASPSPLPDEEPDNVSRSRASSVQSSTRRSHRPGPRDWSEIISLAAMIGFPEEVISRTTQRCATLFQEEMSLRYMEQQPEQQSSITDGKWDELEHYQPELIPEMSTKGDSEDEVSDAESDAEYGSLRARNAFIVSPFVCSDESCAKAFSGPDELRVHLKEAHSLDAKTIKAIVWRANRDWQDSMKQDDLLDPIYNRGWDEEEIEEDDVTGSQSNEGQSVVLESSEE